MSKMLSTKVVRTATRNAEASKARILAAALKEFSDFGLAGARIDSIARKAQVSKPLIYSYFGDKDMLYMAALRAAYIEIRQGERGLRTQDMAPEDAVRELVRFTLNHFVKKPWFIKMLNTENLLGGKTVRKIADAADIQSPLIDQVQEILDRGAESGKFRKVVDPIDFYITVASLCYFPVSNKHTLRAIFGVPIDDAWLERKASEAGEIMVRYLQQEACDDATGKDSE